VVWRCDALRLVFDTAALQIRTANRLFVWREQSSVATAGEIVALCWRKGFRSVESIVKFNVQMICLIGQDRSKWREMRGEAAISLPDIFAIGDGCGDGRVAWRRDF